MITYCEILQSSDELLEIKAKGEKLSQTKSKSVKLLILRHQNTAK